MFQKTPHSCIPNFVIGQLILNKCLSPFAKLFVVAAFSIGLTACGGGEGAGKDGGLVITTSANSVDNGTTITTAGPVNLFMDTDTTQPLTGKDATKVITVTAVNSGNVALSGQTVDITTSSGILTPAGPFVTDASGKVTVNLATSRNDKTNRTVVVTAKSGSVTQKLGVAITGTTLSLTGPSGLSATQGSWIPFSVSLLDGANNPIAGQAVSLSSLAANTLSLSSGGASISSVTTGSNGTAQFYLKLSNVIQGASSATDTITASSNGATGSAIATVDANNTQFTITTNPSDGVFDISDNGTKTLTVTYKENGAIVANKSIRGSVNRGSIVNGSTLVGSQIQQTNSLGQVNFNVSATTVGIANFTATSLDSASNPVASSTLDFEYITSAASQATLQASLINIAPNLAGANGSALQQSTITVKVVDVNNNPVKNANVTFSLPTDPSVGNLSVLNGLTGSDGQASTTYTAGVNSSPTNGVIIKADVSKGGFSASPTTAITVGGSSLYLSVGTNNQVLAPDTLRLTKEFIVTVVDSNGGPIAGAPISAGLAPVQYIKGQLTYRDAVAASGVTPSQEAGWYATTTVTCPNEDRNFNGVIDSFTLPPGAPSESEDINGSGQLEPRIIPVISVVGSGTAGNETNSSGNAKINITYSKQYAQWATYALTVKTLVKGTEGATSRTYTLQPLLSEIQAQSPAPSNQVSPYGTDVTSAPPRTVYYIDKNGTQQTVLGPCFSKN